jgi:hypothetical protein
MPDIVFDLDTLTINDIYDNIDNGFLEEFFSQCKSIKSAYISSQHIKYLPVGLCAKIFLNINDENLADIFDKEPNLLTLVIEPNISYNFYMELSEQIQNSGIPVIKLDLCGGMETALNARRGIYPEYYKKLTNQIDRRNDARRFARVKPAINDN